LFSQGTFLFGIDILTAADYFTVGNLNNCYLIIRVIRELATKALHNLTIWAPECMAYTDQLVSQYLSALESPEVLTRCGCVCRTCSSPYLNLFPRCCLGSRPPVRVQRMMRCLAQQAAEKIDRHRAYASTVFLRLLHSTDPAVPHILHREELLSIFPQETGNSLNWNAASQAFPHITQLLRLHQYQYHTLLGLTVSVGGLTKSTVVPVPLLKMVDQLLAQCCFDLLASEESHLFCGELLSLCTEEIKKSKDVQKLLSSIAVSTFTQQTLKLYSYLYSEDQEDDSQVYEMLLTYDDVIDDDQVLADVMALLGDINWESDIATVQTHRNQLCDWFRVPRPTLVARVTYLGH
ncbi:hypothetical protein cypCar_00029368, partial [Cyprinus carpio]